MNPPYSAPAPWVQKLIASYSSGDVKAALLLVNADTSTRWFHMLEQFPVRFSINRLSFHRGDAEISGNRQGQALFYLGNDVPAFTRLFNQFGAVRRVITCAA